MTGGSTDFDKIPAGKTKKIEQIKQELARLEREENLLKRKVNCYSARERKERTKRLIIHGSYFEKFGLLDVPLEAKVGLLYMAKNYLLDKDNKYFKTYFDAGKIILQQEAAEKKLRQNFKKQTPKEGRKQGT